MSRGSLPPASEQLLSEPAIVARLAEATLGARTTVNWSNLVGDYDRIRDRIAAVIPGFEDYNARVRKPGGFYLGNSARDRKFQTPSGKARFTVHPLTAPSLADGEYMMTTIRSHDQYNTTIYGLEDRYRGIERGRRVVLMNGRDMHDARLTTGARVDVMSMYDGQERVAYGFSVVAYDIPTGCVATYFPEANVLVPLESVADKSNTPTSKSVIVTIRPSKLVRPEEKPS